MMVATVTGQPKKVAHELLVATRGNVANVIEMLLDDDHDLVVSLIPCRMFSFISFMPEGSFFTFFIVLLYNIIFQSTDFVKMASSSNPLHVMGIALSLSTDVTF